MIPFFSCSLQVGTSSYDHQQQHQQAHLLLPWLNLKQKQDFGFSSLITRTRCTVWNWFVFFWHSWSGNHPFWPTCPACDFRGRRDLFRIYGYFNSSTTDGVRRKWFRPVHPSLLFLASLGIQSAYDNHRHLILSTGRDKNFSHQCWEPTSLLGTSSWRHTQQVSPKK